MAAASGRKREDALLRASLVTLGRVGDLISHIRESQVGAGRIVPYVETAAERGCQRSCTRGCTHCSATSRH